MRLDVCADHRVAGQRLGSIRKDEVGFGCGQGGEVEAVLAHRPLKELE